MKPTSEILAEALQAAGAPPQMVRAARNNRYDDFKSESATPISDLVNHCRANSLHGIAQLAMQGMFDSQSWESEEWSHTEEGQRLLADFPQLKPKTN